jgi:glutaminase
VDGKIFSVGDSKHLFTIQSGATPFVFGLALEDHGLESLIKKVGVEPTGMPCNSILPPEVPASKTQNPLVNPGALATTSLIKGKDTVEKYERVHSFMEGLADMKLGIDQETFRSEMAINSKNMGVAWLLKNNGLLYSDVDDAVMRYTKAACIAVSAETLARMGATLAKGGVNPISGRRVLSANHVQDVLSVMTMVGLYDGAGNWWVRVGLPATSGVGGGILAVVPGRFAIAVFSPRLDTNGNSVRAVKLIHALSKRFNLHLLHSR